MRAYILIGVALLSICSSLDVASQNLTVYRSEKSVQETVNNLVQTIMEVDTLIFFETVHHDSIAIQRGLQGLDPTKSILFEDPKLTTALIKCQQTAALDLPLEIIVWQEYGDVYLGFIDPKLMKRRFMISGCDDTINALSGLMVRVCMTALRRKSLAQE